MTGTDRAQLYGANRLLLSQKPRNNKPRARQKPHSGDPGAF